MDFEVDGLSCRRSGRIVLRNVAFTLAAGEAAVLRGPNGVGKSTLLRMLAGFLPVAAGDARLGSISRVTDRQGFQDQIVYAGHLDAVKPALTVSENLRLWAALHGAVAGAVETALDRFGLSAIADRPAAECSAGQKRRLGLARLLVIDRPLWLLDEPTVSLDTASAGLVAELVQAHLAGGGLALVATHIDLGLAAAKEIALTPAADIPTETRDPFLEGTW
ncbi:MAG: heme ABC exporter ATP-binding protein CcmA [Pseudomonadota bacterium]